ncbi:16S rRNA (cytidine(1402)-2'-O)-methyltransferase [Candidatus Nomurabacteria bacterium]|nr:16S rRNA (cytidine(1402)-2'-O)-methyltransferase [Candidatus Nomurabacteria bacterium]
MEEKGTLSIAATPIGNLEDITLRALRVLKEADYVLCEDTRVTGKLLKHYNIETKLKRYDAHASEKVHEQVLADLAAGKHIALVSDAGTPSVSDPGVLLVSNARAAGARVETIPGPSAVTAAFSIAGLTGNQFTFLGFVPQKKGRETFFKALAEYDYPVIFFESTHRIMKTLHALSETYGENSTIYRTIMVARELTKMHEEMVLGTPEEVLTYFESSPEKQRGEFVVIVAPEGRAV